MRWKPFLKKKVKCTMGRKYQVLKIITLLGLLMITVYILIFASYKPTRFKLTFNSIPIGDSEFRFPVSKNITKAMIFLPSKYNLIIKLEPETGLGNRLFMYASALKIALEKQQNLASIWFYSGNGNKP